MGSVQHGFAAKRGQAPTPPFFYRFARDGGKPPYPHWHHPKTGKAGASISSLGLVVASLRFWESLDDDHLCGVWGFACRCAPRSFRIGGRCDAPRRKSSELVITGLDTTCYSVLDSSNWVFVWRICHLHNRRRGNRCCSGFGCYSSD